MRIELIPICSGGGNGERWGGGRSPSVSKLYRERESLEAEGEGEAERGERKGEAEGGRNKCHRYVCGWVDDRALCFRDI